ncbi:MAG: phosphoribosylanthranilate isomerase [Bacteroidota bacterium]
MKLKVCGIRQQRQVVELDQLGIEYIGFIFYPSSPRYMLNGDIDAEWMRSASLNAKKVGVFVNETVEQVVEHIHQWGLDAVQLHGRETPADCSRIRQYARVIKAFSIGNGMFEAHSCEPYFDAMDYALFDTQSERHGGTGKKFDWTLIDWSKIKHSSFISGGIGEQDVIALTQLSSAHPVVEAVDVNSRFELTPGNKDLIKVTQFFNQIKLI